MIFMQWKMLVPLMGVMVIGNWTTSKMSYMACLPVVNKKLSYRLETGRQQCIFL